MKSVLTLAVKDLKLLVRDRFGMFWVIAFPLLMALFFGAIFSGSGGGAVSSMKIAVVDKDHTELSGAFADDLQHADVLEVVPADPKEVHNLVRQGKLVAFVIIPRGFGESGFMFSPETPPLMVGIDPSRRAESAYLKGLLTQSYFRAMMDRYSDPATAKAQLVGVQEEIASSQDLSQDQREALGEFVSSLDRFLARVEPEVYRSGNSWEGLNIQVESIAKDRRGPRSSFEITFPQSIAWGLIGCISAFAISIVQERTGGTLQRLRIAPLSRVQILAGKALACFLSCISVMLFLLLTGRLIFGVRLGRPVLLGTAVITTALCFTGIMMLISVLGKTEQSVAGAGWAVLLVMAMFGGGMVPLAFMPSWMSWGSNLSPVKWGILLIEGAIWRDFSFQEMLFPCSILLSVGLVFFMVGAWIFARMEQ